MKKISTLAFMAFFCCLSALAQVALGDIKFSLKDGAKVSPNTGKITVTFPNVTGVEDPTATTFKLAGAFNDIDFDEIEGTFASGVTFDLAEFELEPSTEYTLKITSVKVGGEEKAAEGGYSLNFKTRGAERKMSWTFAIGNDEASLEQILAEATANSNEATPDDAKYQLVKNPSDGRIYVPACNYNEILLPDGTPLPMTEDLMFKFGAKSFYIADKSYSKNPNRICFNNNNQIMVIPDCKEGDVITLNALYSSKNKGWIQAMNGCAIAIDGLVSTVSGLQDSIRTSDKAANYKFEVQKDGDVELKFGNTFLITINIEEAKPKVPRNYNVVAAYVSDDNTTTLKELVGKTEGITGSTVTVNYPYWLADSEGNAYTYGAKGSPFEEKFDLKNGEGDTTFVISYKKTDFTGVVFLSEGEDLPGAVLSTHANSAIRSSMGKAGYVAEDLKLVSLQPGTYKIRAVLFDANKTPSYVCTLTKGEGENNEIYLSANATNWTEAESDLLTITEATDITLKAGGTDTQGLDIIMIYASTDAPDDPDDPSGITNVNADGQKAARKVMKGGKLLIETEAGTVNVAGILVK